MSGITMISPPNEKENTSVQEIPLDRVRPSANNPRGKIDASSLAELAESIKLHGVLQPVIVRPAATWGYEIVCGERRWRASLMAKRETIPARVMNLSNTEAEEVAAIENVLREDVHPIHEAEGYARILSTNGSYTPETLSQRIGKSVAHIYRRLQLLKLDPKLKGYFLDGQMSATHALVLAGLQPNDQREILSQLKQAQKEGPVEFPSVARLQAWIEENVFLSLDGAPFGKDDAVLVPEAGPCSNCPKRTGFNPLLFPEVKQGNACLDREWFQHKLAAYVEIKVTEAPPDTVKISTSWRFSGETKPEGVLSRDEYRESKKGACEHTVPAIAADGEQIGKMKWVCVSNEQECPVHGASYRSIGESSEAKAERLKRKAEARLEVKRRHAVFEAIRGKARQDR
jgi:ParB family transcriptional regulator, chromosome partitioning protein